MIALDSPVLCLVTALDRMAIPGEDAGLTAERLVEQVEAAARAGVSLIQVREPALESAALHHLVLRCVSAVKGTRCRVLVNDRSDIALAAGAHGVHLREDSIAPEDVRRLVPAPLLLGRSVHSAPDAARIAATASVDYLIFGTVFPTRSKAELYSPAGVAALREAVRAAAPVPVLAIGGVTVGHAAEVARTGAAGIAAIGLFLEESDSVPLEKTVSDLRRSFQHPLVTH